VSIEFMRGDIFKSGADGLVIPVNCEGVMGKGLAKEFKARYPKACSQYIRDAQCGLLLPGTAWMAEDNGGYGFSVIFATTKNQWRNPSQYGWVYSALGGIRKIIAGESARKTVAVPALGCGAGGLDWVTVRLATKAAMHGLAPTILIYEPQEGR
jgi:O-acetyl-ADP-ribose deacetylase (regulator of RNase III)